jgi:hypothetical protein
MNNLPRLEAWNLLMLEHKVKCEGDVVNVIVKRVAHVSEWPSQPSTFYFMIIYINHGAVILSSLSIRAPIN